MSETLKPLYQVYLIILVSIVTRHLALDSSGFDKIFNMSPSRFRWAKVNLSAQFFPHAHWSWGLRKRIGSAMSRSAFGPPPVDTLCRGLPGYPPWTNVSHLGKRMHVWEVVFREQRNTSFIPATIPSKGLSLTFTRKVFFLNHQKRLFSFRIGGGSKTSIGGSLREYASRSDGKVARTNPHITLPETTSLPLKIWKMRFPSEIRPTFRGTLLV